jgi:WD40 repeat protein
MRGLIVAASVALGASAAAAELPPITASFQKSATLELSAVLGEYPFRHAAEVTAVGFSPDGQLLGSVGGDRRVKVWRAADGAELASFGPARGRTYQVLFTGDHRTVATTSSSGKVVLWDIASGAPRTTLVHGAEVTGAVFFDGDRRLASAGRDHAVKVWDTASGALLATALLAPDPDAGGPGPAIVTLTAAPGGRLLCALADGSVVVVDAQSGAVTPGTPPSTAIDAAAFAGAGRLVSAVGGGLRALDLASGAERGLADNLGAPAALAASADGRRALFAGRDGQLAVFDLESGALLYRATASTAELYDAALAPDGSLAVTASRDYTFRVWDVGAKKPWPRAAGQPLYAVTFVDATHVAAAGADGEVRLFDAASGAVRSLGQHTGAVYGLAALDASAVVSAGDDGTLRFFDLGGAPAVVVPAHRGGVLAVAASRDGKRLVSAGADDTVRGWDARRHRRAASLPMSAAVAALALAPDGKTGVAGDDGGVVKRFAVPSLAPLGRPRGHQGLVLGAAVTSDGKTVLTASEDDTVRRTTLANGATALLTGHRARVRSVVALGARHAVSASKDGTLVVWDLAAGQAIDHLDLSAADDQPEALALSPDGQMLAVATARGVVLLYRVRLP